MNYFSFTIMVKQDIYEEVVGVCYIHGMDSCEEKYDNNNVELTCFFEDQNSAEIAKGALQNQFTISVSEVVEVVQQDWNAKWRESMEPVKVTDSVWVSPEWLEPPCKEGDTWIKIEPKMAFGTGHHATTRLSSQEIVRVKQLNDSYQSILDIGTGSGILCFLADHYGYTESYGVEIDPDCEENLEENLNLNSPKGSIHFKIGTVDKVELPNKFDTIVMNMIRTRSEPYRDYCHKHLTDNGTLVWSGILVEEKDSLIEETEQHGWSLQHETTEGEWWCGSFKKMS